MPIEILMPALSPTMTEGALASWQKSVGDRVEAGDVVAEIETDKATIEIEAADAGVLGKILVEAGTGNIAVNRPIALILSDGESPTDLEAFQAAGTAQAAGGPFASGEGAEPEAADGSISEHRADKTRLFASPLARRIAALSDIDLTRVAGSGPNGRIVKNDVEAAADKASAPPAPVVTDDTGPRPASPALPAVADDAVLDVLPHSAMRRTIAARLTQAKRDIPHFYLSVDCRLDACLTLRAELNGRAGADYRLSVNDFVVRAAALAMREVPAVNASWGEDAIARLRQVDISVAVALEEGLITPIVRNAGHKGLSAISNEIKALAERARAGELAPEEYQGGSFSISNLGMYGIDRFAAIINPPQSCILAVGAGEQRPVVTDGALGVATVMTCTLSADHRVVDGALGAEFLGAFRRIIEDPLTLLL